MTVSQVVAGVVFTIPEIVGPIAGFAILGLFAIWVVVALLRHIEEAWSGWHWLAKSEVAGTAGADQPPLGG